MKLCYAIALAVTLLSTHAASAQGTQSRLIATSIRDYSNGVSFELTDSSHFHYSNDRGGDLLHPMKYDSGFAWKYIASVLTEDKRTYRTFDLDDNILVNREQIWDAGTSLWEDLYLDSYAYGTGQLPLTQVRLVWNSGTTAWDSFAKTVYTYDTDGNMLTRNLYAYNTGTNGWDNDEQHTYTYDTDGNETSYTYQSWDGTTWMNETKKLKTYTNDDMALDVWQQWSTTLNDWENDMQFLYTYDGNHNILTRTDQQWLNAAWVNYQLVTNTYTGGDPTLVEQQIWNTGSSSWDNSARSLNTFDGNHNLTEGINQWWNGFNDYENSTRMLREYNNYSQMTFQTIQNWDGTAWVPFLFDQEYRFYYEEFTPITTIAGSAAARGSYIKLYPVPAANSITIEITGELPSQHSLSILDMQGSLIKHFGNTFNAKRNIPLDELPAGSYLLKITGADKTIAYKQFTVAR